jgi:hypothetical protein
VRTLKLFVGLAVIAAAVYLGVQLVPPFFANYQFQDAIENEALLDSYSSKTEDDVRQAVLKKAQDLELPIRPEQVQVQRTGTSGGVAIWADYTVHVDIPYYPLDIDFHPASKNKPIPGA